MRRKAIASTTTTVLSVIVGLFMWGSLGIEDVLLSINSYSKMVCFVYLFISTMIATSLPIYDLVLAILEYFDIGDDFRNGGRFA